MADDELEKTANDRLKEARLWKSRRIFDFKECYFFAAPDRMRDLTSTTRPTQTYYQDAGELNTDVAFLLVADFLTEVFNAFMPQAQPWCERKAGMDVPESIFDQVKDQVKLDDKKIFEAMKASNLYSELPKAGNPDLAIAGCGLVIKRRKPHLPIEVLAVPMREIEINLGPNGEVDDRFIVRFTRNCYVKMLLGEDVWSKVSDAVKKECTDNPAKETEVRWGWWQLWDRDDETWQHVVMIKNELVHDVEIKGEGCCEFIFMRFNPVADWPWAIGPLIQGLPTLRQVDELERQLIEAIERAVNPPISYPDDSFAQVEQGLEPGMAYPVRPGSAKDIQPMYQQPNMSPELMGVTEKVKILRKLFFIDHPEQTGDTPPTLGQWLDELARAQRRIGTPGLSFWREGPMRIFLRYKYLLERAGTIKPLQNGGRLISTQAYNPTQRAAEQQEISTAMQAGQIGANLFPEEWKIVTDGAKTIKNFITKMRVTDLIAMRDPGQIQARVDQIAQLTAGKLADASPAAPSAGPPGAPAA